MRVDCPCSRKFLLSGLEVKAAMARTMSGSGGFYKYRCKYFYAKSCQNWVYVNGEACITCLVSPPSIPPLLLVI